MLIGSGYITSKGDLSWAGMATMVFKEALELTEPLPPGATDLVDIPGTGIPVRVTRLDPEHPFHAPPRPPRQATAPDITDTPEDDLTIPQPMAAGAISYSQLERWSKCGLRRYLERDLGLSGDDSRISADTTGEGTLPAGDPDRDGRDFGHLVHECLERVDWKAGMDIPALTQWATDHRAATDGDIARLIACLERARDHEVATTLATATEVQAEVPFATLIDGYLITGVIDVLATLPDGSTLIVDWKTGEHFEEHEADYDLQRRLYTGAMLDLANPPPLVETRWVALEGRHTEKVQRASRYEHSQVRSDLDSYLRQSLAERPAPAVAERDGRCSGCPGLSQVCRVTSP